MNLDETSEDFRRKLDLAPPNAQIRVILKLNLPEPLPLSAVRGITREERRKIRIANVEQLDVASIPIKDQLDAIGLKEATILSAMSCAIVYGTPEQIKSAVALESVTGAMHDTETVLIQGQQDDTGHASRVTEERKDKGPPQVGG